jgi:hypothetical protein
MQAPGRPDEDRRDGFAHGGWARPRGESVSQAFGGIGEVGGLLFGRRTYYVLLIHPLVLGTGRRLFAEGSPTTTLQLVDSKTTATGVVIATYPATESMAPATT